MTTIAKIRTRIELAASQTPVSDVAQPYLLELVLEGLPKTTNTLARCHWRSRHGHAQTWHRKVIGAIGLRAPPEPLERARLTYTRCSTQECDFDGLVSSFKHVQDALIKAGVIVNDRRADIGQPTYLWESAPQRKGHIKIKVESVA